MLTKNLNNQHQKAFALAKRISIFKLRAWVKNISQFRVKKMRKLRTQREFYIPQISLRDNAEYAFYLKNEIEARRLNRRQESLT